MKYTSLLPIALLALPFSAATMASTPSPVLYNISVDDQNPLVTKVKVDTAAFANIKFLPSRTMRDSAQPDLICQQQGQADRQIDFGTQVSCDSVSWTLAFSETPPEGLDASLQHNAYSSAKGWHLLSEWNSLPRIEGVDNVQVCIDSTQVRCQPLPPLSSPPLFMAWGMEEITLDIEGVPVRLQTDQHQVLQQASQWQPVLSHQIRYLNAIFKLDKIEPWSLVWLKREKSSGSIGGAAGDRIYIANVPTENGKLASNAYRHLLKISAHESMHFLSSIQAPLWANESLAEYYAIKSLNDTDFAFPAPTESWQRIGTKMPHGATGLYEASRLVSEEHKFQYYGLFYTKGPAFWAALDSQLQLQGDTLDHHLGKLATNWQTEIPPQFVEAIRKKIGAKTWADLEREYL